MEEESLGIGRGNDPPRLCELARTLGCNVHRLRRKQRLHKYVLSDMAGVSRPYLNAIERGMADVRLSTVQDLADALCVSPIELLLDLHFSSEDHEV